MLLKVTQNNKKLIANSMSISTDFTLKLVSFLDDIIDNV